MAINADSTKISNAKAADPGIAFDLDLTWANEDFPSVETITVELHVEASAGERSEHVSTLTFHGPINEAKHCIVLPYGCGNYPAGSSVNFRVKLTIERPNQANIVIWRPSQTTWTNVSAQRGVFSASRLTAE